ncbi:MAG: hypothetical protein ACI8T1_001127 [Verrucomicrobiales bacterium]
MPFSCNPQIVGERIGTIQLSSDGSLWGIIGEREVGRITGEEVLRRWSIEGLSYPNGSSGEWRDAIHSLLPVSNGPTACVKWSDCLCQMVGLSWDRDVA